MSTYVELPPESSILNRSCADVPTLSRSRRNTSLPLAAGSMSNVKAFVAVYDVRVLVCMSTVNAPRTPVPAGSDVVTITSPASPSVKPPRPP